jgi:hypothetical protein
MTEWKDNPWVIGQKLPIHHHSAALFVFGLPANLARHFEVFMRLLTFPELD